MIGVDRFEWHDGGGRFGGSLSLRYSFVDFDPIYIAKG